ncbi:hypothetical protein WICPIJ_002549 [Wickerhamomyces pijperi]|uniref:J domain-containing protein n=1 Tax=Wickerhamomyces pijperi TaxID=599730 RepID=A0A9P8Q8R4_WICPI|nr:hypothetical protein WICPIJ_002549 [Wickerhamomyces pijperi]
MSDRSYTKEQEVIVERILKHNNHEYYKILEIEKTSTESEIKKAYRKISLKVHPDKNGHPKADECFKRVNKAFEVLGDASKKRIFDQTGADPDSRFGASSSSSGGHPGFQGHPGFNFNGFPQGGSPFGFQAGPGAGAFQADDLFDILFGGGAGGTTFTFGGPGGVRFTTAGGNPFNGGGGFQQRRPHTAGGQGQRQANQGQVLSSWEVLKQLLPVLLVIALPLISNFFFGSDSVENYQFQKNYKYSNELISPKISIPYYVTTKTKNNLTPKKLTKLNRAVEEEYIDNLRTNCQYEKNEKERRINEAYGWFFPDEEKLNKAQALKLPTCERLEEIATMLL